MAELFALRRGCLGRKSLHLSPLRAELFFVRLLGELQQVRKGVPESHLHVFRPPCHMIGPLRKRAAEHFQDILSEMQRIEQVGAQKRGTQSPRSRSREPCYIVSCFS